jgi:hypothetical protein
MRLVGLCRNQGASRGGLSETASSELAAFRVQDRWDGFLLWVCGTLGRSLSALPVRRQRDSLARKQPGIRHSVVRESAIADHGHEEDSSPSSQDPFEFCNGRDHDLVSTKGSGHEGT